MKPLYEKKELLTDIENVLRKYLATPGGAQQILGIGHAAIEILGMIRVVGFNEAMEVVMDMRVSESGLFEPKYSGQRGQDRSDALHDAYLAIGAARTLRATQSLDPPTLESVLPCDVRLPPATTVRKGCSYSTLMLAISLRENRPEADTVFPDRPDDLERQKVSIASARPQALMTPGDIDALNPTVQGSWKGTLASMRDALAPFAGVGQWLFARDLPDDTPMVTMDGINGHKIVLTRGHFKAAHRVALNASPGSAGDADEDWNIRKFVDFLRADEGDSVTLLCDNPEGPPNNAIECNGYWTGWNDRRYEGETLLAALELAYFECRQWREANVAALTSHSEGK